MDENYTVDDLSEEARSHARTDCTSFILNNWEDLVSSGLSAEYAGHDFWLTRCRHGAGFGFWNRGLGEVGDRLTEAAHGFGEVNLYVGDDGTIYDDL